jgi:radical SAM protein with 4Fe4S-binding SPASM domain
MDIKIIDKFVSDCMRDDIQLIKTMITGGEPMLNIPLVIEVCKRLKPIMATPRIVINSNMTVLDGQKEELRVLRSLFPGAYLFFSQISYDNEEVDTFCGGTGVLDKIQSGIDLCNSVGLRVATGLTITKNNCNHQFIDQFFKYVMENNIQMIGMKWARANYKLKDSASFRPSPEQFRDIVEYSLNKASELGLSLGLGEFPPACLFSDNPIFKNFKRSCGAFDFLYYINAEGMVRPCPDLIDYNLGDIRKDDMKTIIENTRKIRDNIMQHHQCNGVCDYFNKGCEGGCYSERLLLGGNFEKYPIWGSQDPKNVKL